jgi:hypothetical protein
MRTEPNQEEELYGQAQNEEMEVNGLEAEGEVDTEPFLEPQTDPGWTFEEDEEPTGASGAEPPVESSSTSTEDEEFGFSSTEPMTTEPLREVPSDEGESPVPEDPLLTPVLPFIAEASQFPVGSSEEQPLQIPRQGIAGDIDGSGAFDLADLLVIRLRLSTASNRFGRASTPPNCWALADFDADGAVTALDLEALEFVHQLGEQIVKESDSVDCTANAPVSAPLIAIPGGAFQIRLHQPAPSGITTSDEAMTVTPSESLTGVFDIHIPESLEGTEGSIVLEWDDPTRRLILPISVHRIADIYGDEEEGADDGEMTEIGDGGESATCPHEDKGCAAMILDLTTRSHSHYHEAQAGMIIDRDIAPILGNGSWWPFRNGMGCEVQHFRASERRSARPSVLPERSDAFLQYRRLDPATYRAKRKKQETALAAWRENDMTAANKELRAHLTKYADRLKQGTQLNFALFVGHGDKEELYYSNDVRLAIPRKTYSKKIYSAAHNKTCIQSVLELSCYSGQTVALGKALNSTGSTEGRPNQGNPKFRAGWSRNAWYAIAQTDDTAKLKNFPIVLKGLETAIERSVRPKADFSAKLVNILAEESFREANGVVTLQAKYEDDGHRADSM